MTDMTHPKPSDIRASMERLQSVVADNPDPHLDMDETRVRRTHKCGTIACFGGWYAYAKMCDEIEFDEDGLAMCPFDQRSHLDFTIGADMLAADLEFADRYDLEYWAATYTQIWGNPSGGDMFSGEAAFCGNDSASIHDVIAHWRGVADRIEAAT